MVGKTYQGKGSAMTRPSVVVVSRQGRPGLAAAGIERIEARATVSHLERTEPMTLPDARGALRGAALIAVTPLTAPRIDASLLDALPDLRGVAWYATGYEVHDLPLLRRRRVRLRTLPDYATTSVSEHAIALLLALSRRVPLANDRSRGLAPDDVSLRGFDLAGRTMGIVGLGRIGSRVAALGRAFGMTVVATDVVPKRVPGVRMVPLPALLSGSDAVVVCCPLVAGAAAVLGAAELASLRPGAVLVNIGRPQLVDSPGLLTAVRSGRLRGYAVDEAVFGSDAEPLLSEGRIIQTGHSAWWSDETLAQGARHWVQAMEELLDGLEPVRSRDARRDRNAVSARPQGAARRMALSEEVPG